MTCWHRQWRRPARIVPGTEIIPNHRYPGTISLRTQTFLAVVEDIVRWVHRQGFRRLMVINGHGGNAPATALLSELVNGLSGLRVDWYAWCWPRR